ncbi:hypothetical protein HDU79_001302 [Rhizoclosmatium sp. JEL0117]|nr:hypothetical protein HDU79_001302 [Rhizoclosmatium sp. JEL0117]
MGKKKKSRAQTTPALTEAPEGDSADDAMHAPPPIDAEANGPIRIGHVDGGVFALDDDDHHATHALKAEEPSTVSTPTVSQPIIEQQPKVKLKLVRNQKLHPQPQLQSQRMDSDPTPVSLAELSFNPHLASAASTTTTATTRRRAKQKPIAHSSIMSQIGTLVKGTLASAASPNPQPSSLTSIPANPNAHEHVLCSKFISMTFYDGLGKGNNVGHASNNGSLCLLLGYNNGFQIWSISSLPNGALDVLELVSVRNGMNRVTDLDVISLPVGELQRESISQEALIYSPLVVISESSSDNEYAVKLYSLKTHTVTKTWRFEHPVLSVKVTNRLIVVGLANSTLEVYSSITLNHLTHIPDSHPVFAPGSSLLVYASTSKAPKQSNPVDGDILLDANSNSVQERVTEGLKKATGKVVKEAIAGAGYLSNVGYTAVSNYLYPNSAPSTATSTPEPEIPNSERKAEGTVAILSIPLSHHFNSSTAEIIAHWKPHTNPITNLTLNQTQTLLFTSSTAANTFYIHQLRSSGTPHILYKLERGYTPARIESVSFSQDGWWCGVSTARGTTHLYPIPARKSGGKIEEELGLLNGWVEGVSGNIEGVRQSMRRLAGDSGVLYPAARLKQTISGEEEGEESSVGKRVRGALGIGFLLEGVGAPVGPGSSRRGSVTNGLSISPSLSGMVGGGADDSVRLLRQRIVSYNPTGVLSLHYLDVTINIGDSASSPADKLSSTAVGSYGASPRSRIGSLQNGSSFLSSAAAGVLRQSQPGHPRASVNDVMQWDVLRSSDWMESKLSLEPAQEPLSPWKSRQWATQIETSTYDSVLFGAPIWMDATYRMCLYTSDDEQVDGGVESAADLSDLPLYKKLEVRRDATPLDSRRFPTMIDSHLGPDISMAMGDNFRSQSVRQTPVWMQDGLSFDDALVVEEGGGGDDDLGVSVQLGYFGTLEKRGPAGV